MRMENRSGWMESRREQEKNKGEWMEDRSEFEGTRKNGKEDWWDECKKRESGCGKIVVYRTKDDKERDTETDE